jgi:RPA family protein
VDELTRNLWVLDTAKQTLERIRAVEAQEDPNSKLAKEHYSVDTETYREMVRKALESLKDNT